MVQVVWPIFSVPNQWSNFFWVKLQVFLIGCDPWMFPRSFAPSFSWGRSICYPHGIPQLLGRRDGWPSYKFSVWSCSLIIYQNYRWLAEDNSKFVGRVYKVKGSVIIFWVWRPSSRGSWRIRLDGRRTSGRCWRSWRFRWGTPLHSPGCQSHLQPQSNESWCRLAQIHRLPNLWWWNCLAWDWQRCLACHFSLLMFHPASWKEAWTMGFWLFLCLISSFSSFLFSEAGFACFHPLFWGVLASQD